MWQKRIFFWILGAGSFFVLVFGAEAALDRKFREKFPEIVAEFCHSAGDYSLNRDFAEVQTEFHKTVNCAFNDAFEASSLDSKDRAEAIFGDVLLGLETAEIADDCVGKLAELQAGQKSAGLETSCDFEIGDQKFPTGEAEFSGCRVAETIWTEFCGYEKFLWGKIRDDETDPAEISAMKKREDNDWKWKTRQIDVIILKDEVDQMYAFELKKTRESIWQAIELYGKFEKNYRLHSFLVAIRAELMKTNEKLFELLKGVLSWPKKFIGSSSRNCRQ